MADNPKKRKADGRRVALTQEHEREYLIKQLEMSEALLHIESVRLSRLIERIRAGFPGKRARK